MPEYDSTIRYAEIPELPGYMAGTDGTIWSCWKRRGLGCGRGTASYMSDEWRAIKPCLHGGRAKKDRRPIVYYMGFDAKGVTFRVHIAVLLAFYGAAPSPNMVCRHLNGKPTDNRLENLSWGTSVQNNRDRVTHGTMSSGDRNGNVRFSDAQVLEMGQLIADGLSQDEVARHFHTGRSSVCYCLRIRLPSLKTR